MIMFWSEFWLFLPKNVFGSFHQTWRCAFWPNISTFVLSVQRTLLFVNYPNALHILFKGNICKQCLVTDVTLFAHNTSSNMIAAWVALYTRAFLCITGIPSQVWCQGDRKFNGDHRCLIKSCNRAQAGIGSIHPGIYRPSSVTTDFPVEILYSE